MIKRIQVLAGYPDMGRIVPEFQSAHIREIIFTPFRIVYLREKDAIKVICVWRSARILFIYLNSSIT